MKFRVTIENAALAQRAGLAATAAWLLAAGASDAAAQSRDLTMLCQGGGSMIVELAPAANNATQVVLAIRAVMSDVGPEQPRIMRLGQRPVLPIVGGRGKNAKPGHVACDFYLEERR